MKMEILADFCRPRARTRKKEEKDPDMGRTRKKEEKDPDMGRVQTGEFAGSLAGRANDSRSQQFTAAKLIVDYCLLTYLEGTGSC
jgi:hypothetical protein